MSTVTRLGKLILHQATPFSPISAGEPNLSNLINKLSDDAMARMIGSVRAVVNRHIQEFTELGLITTSKGELVVKDLENLRKHCENALSK